MFLGGNKINILIAKIETVYVGQLHGYRAFKRKTHKVNMKFKNIIVVQ